jgi:hypothetical protein
VFDEIPLLHRNLGAERGEGLDEDGGLDGHVEGARDPGAGSP